MFKIVTKLKKLKGVLKELNKVKFSNIEIAAYEAKQQMLNIQESIQKDPTDGGLQHLETDARRKYFALNKAINSFLKQKAKQEWLTKGDLNTQYFHACLKKRRMQNKICRIQDM